MLKAGPNGTSTSSVTAAGPITSEYSPSQLSGSGAIPTAPLDGPIRWPHEPSNPLISGRGGRRRPVLDQHRKPTRVRIVATTHRAVSWQCPFIAVRGFSLSHAGRVGERRREEAARPYLGGAEPPRFRGNFLPPTERYRTRALR